MNNKEEQIISMLKKYLKDEDEKIDTKNVTKKFIPRYSFWKSINNQFNMIMNKQKLIGPAMIATIALVLIGVTIFSPKPINTDIYSEGDLTALELHDEDLIALELFEEDEQIFSELESLLN